MSGGLSGIDWRLVIGITAATVVLALTNRFLHYNTQIIPAALVGMNRLALWLYALVMWPGTLLHEVSHALTALVLLVEVQHISLVPTVEGDRVTLGYVRLGKTDVLRHSLIGLAPIIVGIGAILFVGVLAFDLDGIHAALTAGDWATAIHALGASLSSKWDLLAVYLIFVVSANMFPSPSDRRAWLPVLFFLAIIAIAAVVAGVGSVLEHWLAAPVNTILRWILFAMGFTLAIDLPILFLLAAGTRAVFKRRYDC